MNISLNGSVTTIATDSCVTEAVRCALRGDTNGADIQDGEAVIPTEGLAVALNGLVVPRSAWETTLLHENDVVDVLTAFVGG